ncbi:uncharacterized protein N7473_012534, partial [Penicillium subrubescens]|uniref:uncharacterized protein n=1 Tax=Penicillium subrubescens TaxID=1316194 RepID=UPI002545A81A
TVWAPEKGLGREYKKKAVSAKVSRSNVLTIGSTFSPRVDPEGGISYEPLETRYQYNLLASGAHWVLLTGYLVIPGTFTSLQKSDTLHNTLSDNEAGEIILKSIQNPPLLALASVFFVVGLALLGRLYYKYRSNYI